MLIRLDGKYTTRDGRAVTGLRRTQNSSWPWEGYVGGRSLSWTDCGEYRGRSMEDPWDLIEAIAPTPDALIEQTCAAFAELRKNDGRVPAGKNLEMICSGNWAVAHSAGDNPVLHMGSDYRLTPIPAPVVGPESPRFKAGDRMRCVDLSDIERGPFDKVATYTVQSVQFDGEEWFVYFDGINGGWRQHRFELVPPVPRFTVSTDPCGVLDSEQPGMIAKFANSAGCEACIKIIKDGMLLPENYNWEPLELTRTVPLGPEDVPPGSAISCSGGTTWAAVTEVRGASIIAGGRVYYWQRLKDDNAKILRPGQTEWQPCSKQVPV